MFAHAFVAKRIRQVCAGRMTYEDAISEMYLGFRHAVMLYERGRGASLTTYAHFFMLSSFNEARASMTGMTSANASSIPRARYKIGRFLTEFGRRPTPPELAKLS